MSPISVVIAGYARSPFHFARKGALVDIRPDDLAAAVLKGLVEKLDLDPALLEDVVMGCAYPEAEQGMNIARIASFRAGFPQSLGGATLNRFCGSSMSAVHYAAGQVLLGAGEAFIAAGVESMTRVPMGGFNLSPNPALLQDYPAVYMSMGQTAENVAERYAVSRVEQEEMAVRSHAKAVAAREAGLLREEIVAIDTPAGRVAEDGCIRPGTNLESLAQLKPAFGGSVTAATSSPLTDGSAALLVCSEDPIHRLHPRTGAGHGQDQPGWRRPGHRSSAGRHRRADHRQGRCVAAAHRRALCHRHPVHRRRPGRGDPAGSGGVIARR